MDALVRATGSSRQGIYADFGGKKDLYLSALDSYGATVVDPAFGSVERPGANLSDVAAFLEFQIGRAEAGGLPGPGCMVANAMTECAPHDEDIQKKVDAHNGRLTAGFANALTNEAPALPAAEIQRIASFLTIAAQGLWSFSRSTSDAAALRATAQLIVEMVRHWSKG